MAHLGSPGECYILWCPSPRPKYSDFIGFGTRWFYEQQSLRTTHSASVCSWEVSWELPMEVVNGQILQDWGEAAVLFSKHSGYSDGGPLPIRLWKILTFPRQWAWKPSFTRALWSSRGRLVLCELSQPSFSLCTIQTFQQIYIEDLHICIWFLPSIKYLLF